MDYEELVAEDPLLAEYKRIYAGYEHACSYEEFLLRRRFEERITNQLKD